MTTSKYKTLDYLTTDEIHRLIRYFNKMGNHQKELLIELGISREEIKDIYQSFDELM